MWESIYVRNDYVFGFYKVLIGWNSKVHNYESVDKII